MSEVEFWRCTPRKLYALMEVHNDLQGGSGAGKKKPISGFIDQVL